jgi:hypothetical protein
MAATLTMGDTAPDTPKRFPLRKRTGTAAHHMSKAAVGFGLDDLDALSPKEVVFFMADLLWGSHKEMACPHCGTADTHYWTFSVSSGTVFADRKLPLVKILKMVFSWANGAAGKPALQLRRDWNVTYKTAFTLAHKLREGLLRGFNVGVLCGIQEMDGMDVNGRRYREKRNKPLDGGAAGKPKIPAHLLKPSVDPETGEIQGPPKPPKWDKKARQPADRRLLVVMRQRSQAKKKGAVATRIGIALSETAATVVAMAKKFASAESSVMSDEDPAYYSFSKLFSQHQTINHSKGYSDGKGVSNNLAESFNWRMRRSAEGIYLSPSNKYLADYAAENAWREDTRKLSTLDRLSQLLRTAMGVGLSQWWRGYVQGQHREHEMLVEGELPAKGRGRPKGWKPKPPS